MKILITGITGLLGSYLAKDLQGYGEIHGLKRERSSLRLLNGVEGEIHWHTGDVTDYQSLSDAVDNMDLVIHSAGLVSFLPKDQKQLLEINTQGTANVVNVMLEKGIKRLAFVSSVAALGRDVAQPLIDENFKWVSSDLNTPYGISKHMAELEVWRGCQEGLEVMVFNPSVILAKVADERSSSSIYQYILQGNSYYPKGSINYIDVRDAVLLIRTLIERAPWNERYILNAATESYQSFFCQMAEVFGKKPPNKPVTAGVLKLVVAWTKLTNPFRQVPLMVNKQTAELAQLHTAFDNTKVQSILNHSYIPLKQTLTWALVNEKTHHTV